MVLYAILQIADMQETLKTLEEEARDLKSQTEQVKSDVPITMLYIMNKMLIVIPSHNAF
jgi:archaellum component FlaC